MQRIEESLAGVAPSLGEILRVAAGAALLGGKVIRDLFGKPHQIRMKGVIDLVTEADLAAEQTILDHLHRSFPAAVLAEESNREARGDIAGSLWIVDPLDGTTNFAHGFPYFGVSIAYCLDQVSQAGVVYCPIQDELFWAIRGQGAWLDGQHIRVSGRQQLIQSLVATGFPYDIEENLHKVIGQLGKILPRVRDLRRAGAAAVDLAYVACGRLDGFWEMGLQPWDTAAGSLLVEEAGGTVGTFAGKTWDPWCREILASNGKIHKQLGALLG